MTEAAGCAAAARGRVIGRSILRWPDTQLTDRARPIPIGPADRGLCELAAEMIALMRGGRGLGLAAPQVGESIRMIVVDPLSGPPPIVLLNPVINARGGRRCFEEGCLSLPGVAVETERAEHVLVRARGLAGDPITWWVAGPGAACIQHEIDHLDGILIRTPAAVRT